MDKPSSFNVNFLGAIPYNPDNLPEDQKATGVGTMRPIGMTLTDMAKFYWTVRSFKINLTESYLGSDPLSDFLSGGGTSGGIIGANAGLSAANQSLSNNSKSSSLKGYTKVIINRQRKVRVQPDGVHDGKMVTSIAVSKDANPKIFTSHNVDVNEGQIAGAGPVHTLASSDGNCLIDFSDIIYAKHQYWPIIKITIGILSSQNLGANNATVYGGVNFLGCGQISFFGFSTAVNPVYSIGGTISIGDRCSDRFYWDGHDDERIKGSNKCATWKDPLYTTLPKAIV